MRGCSEKCFNIEILKTLWTGSEHPKYWWETRNIQKDGMCAWYIASAKGRQCMNEKKTQTKIKQGMLRSDWGGSNADEKNAHKHETTI